MCAWHIAGEDEVRRLWPAVRSAHVCADADEFERIYRNGPWRIRISDTGDAALLGRWRAHLDALALRGVWAPAHRMDALLADASSVTVAQGFSELLSPLLPQSSQDPYFAAGMAVREDLVVLQGLSRHSGTRPGGSLRQAVAEDAEKLAAADSACFDEFWRHGPGEWAEIISRERVMILEDEGRVLAYASAAVHGAVCTLGRLGVAADARRRGLGRAMVVDALEWAFRRGVPLVSLCTQRSNEASRSLYGSLGLVELEEPYALLSRGVGGTRLSDTL